MGKPISIQILHGKVSVVVLASLQPDYAIMKVRDGIGVCNTASDNRIVTPLYQL